MLSKCIAKIKKLWTIKLKIYLLFMWVRVRERVRESERVKERLTKLN